jgi:WbqC-like protein family
MKVVITQPTYLPWIGYFDLIDQADLFIVLDNVQFEKQSWQQRNRIRTATGLQWLTVPVKFRGRLGQLIREVEIRDAEFWQSHVRAIELAYRRTPNFNSYLPDLRGLLQKLSTGLLVDLNIGLLHWFLQVLQIRTPVVTASSLGQTGKRTELLANLCECVGATHYLSPLGSAAYLLSEANILQQRGVEILFQNYEHPTYRQLFEPFCAFACIADLLFNEGGGALGIVRAGRRPAYCLEDVAALAQTG